MKTRARACRIIRIHCKCNKCHEKVYLDNLVVKATYNFDIIIDRSNFNLDDDIGDLKSEARANDFHFYVVLLGKCDCGEFISLEMPMDDFIKRLNEIRKKTIKYGPSAEDQIIEDFKLVNDEIAN
jgi:hypothetical protein